MSDLKSKLPDPKELTGMAGKLFGDVKKSVVEIIGIYKEKHKDAPETTETKTPEASAPPPEAPAQEAPTQEESAQEATPTQEEPVQEEPQQQTGASSNEEPPKQDGEQ